MAQDSNQPLSDKVDTSLYSRREARLDADNRWYAGALELLYDMGASLGETLGADDAQHVLTAVQGLLERVLDWQSIAILLSNDISAEFEIRHCHPAADTAQMQAYCDRLIDSGDFAWALNRNQVQQVLLPGSAEPLVLNVIATRNRIRGMLLARPAPGAVLSQAAAKLVSVLMHHCAYALESAALYNLVDQQKRRLKSALRERNRALEYQASHDLLTGLANRPALLEALEQAMGQACLGQTRVALLYLELIQFKRFRASYGHHAGDELLRQVGRRIAGVLGIADTGAENPGPDRTPIAARLSGEAFAVVLPGQRHLEHAEAQARALHEALREPFELDDQRLYLDHGLGLSHYPDQAVDAEALLHQATLACTYARRSGRNTILHYHDGMLADEASSLVLESELRDALEDGQLLLHYQPRIDLHSGRVCGVEALVRWQHPRRGLVGPGEFIELAEASGLISRLGEVVLEMAAAQAGLWQARLDFDFRVAVNLSVAQFRNPDLVDSVMACLARQQAVPQWLELEITETAITEDLTFTAAALMRFHDLGFTLALDDFGTGYSSLAAIKRFPIDTLKIDRSFVSELDDDSEDAAIVAAVIAMGRRLKLRVVAEGVETARQLQILRDLGCDEVQGFLLGRPMSAAALEAWLAARPAAGPGGQSRPPALLDSGSGLAHH